MARCRSAISCGRVTSVAMNRAFAPVAAAISATAFSPTVRRRPATTTSAPRRAKASAAARPIPVAPPVTSTTLPSKSRIGSPGVGHGVRRVADQQARLEADGHALDDAARPRLVLLGGAQLRLEPLDHAIEAPITALRAAHLVEEDRHALRRAAGGTQHVESDDVAAALPDAVERRFTVEPRHRPLLDEAIAAVAFQ